MKNKSKQPYAKPKGHPVLNLSGKAIGELVKEFMTKGKSIKFRSKGQSMHPIIKEEDLITVSPYIRKVPVSGDIIAYINPETEKMIIHRLIKITPDTFTAKGDNCLHHDSSHDRSNILGYVSQINQKKFKSNALLSHPIKKTLIFLSSIGIIFILNKFLKRIQLVL